MNMILAQKRHLLLPIVQLYLVRHLSREDRPLCMIPYLKLQLSL